MTTRRISTRALQPGDSLAFLGKLYRVTGIEPYDGPFDDCFGIAAVEGHGAFMSLFEDSSIEVAA